MPWPLAVLALAGCTSDSSPEPAEPEILVDRGVDLERKVLRVGALNDESGPGAPIGVPFAAGKRVLAAAVKAGDTDALPDGWTIELVEHDHGSNPEKVAASFDAVKDEVLYIATSFGTQNTIGLRQELNEHTLVAFPASLSSEMSKHPFTPPLGASYRAEARRALDFMVDRQGSPQGIKAGIVYVNDPYGIDAAGGFAEAAKQYGVAVVARVEVSPGELDATAVLDQLTAAGPTHVLLAVLPDTTAAVLGAAHEASFAPTWIGATPAWVDRFFDGPLPPEAFATYTQASSLPWWGEDVPGMAELVAAFEAHGKGAPHSSYALMSYAQGLAGLAAAKRAIEAGDVTRQGFYRALTTLRSFDAGGLVRPIDLSSRPYALAEEVRILRPVFAERSWKVVMDYGRPGVPPRMRPGQEALDDANAAYPPGEGL